MKITQDFFKKCDQRVVRLDVEYYSDGEISDLIQSKVLHDAGDWVIGLKDIDRIEIEINEFSWLATVAYLQDGTRLYVLID